MDNDIILDFQNVTKKFPGVTALEDVSFKIKRGRDSWDLWGKRSGKININVNSKGRSSVGVI